jgi:hypothetical protein
LANGKEEEGKSKQCLGFEPLRGGDQKIAAVRQRCWRAALAVPQAAWHSGEEPTGETRAVEERAARRVERGAEPQDGAQGWAQAAACSRGEAGEEEREVEEED